ncbi:ABC transporter substrate-binding protein [Rhodobacterales bacterium HKCCE3408]|nr:ABC transporter substrate-binding protein [Rhodobacterales bacterium HKCCE3408]
MKIGRINRLAGVVLAFALGAAGLAGGAAAQDCSVKVGAVLPISVDWGQPIAEVAQFAVDQANEGGGIGGCDIDLVLRDSQVNPSVGVDAARALVDLDGVELLIGAVSSGVTVPILTSVTVPAGVMQISCCSASTALTDLAANGETNGLWFRTFATADVQAAVTAQIAAEQGLESAVVFYKNDDWGQDYGARVAGYLESMGIAVTDSIALNDAQPSYRAEITQGLQGNPGGAVLVLYPTEGAVAVREWLSLGGSQTFVMSNSLRSDEFSEAVGLEYLGNALGMDNAAPRVPSADAFVAAYVERFGSQPNGPGIPNSYDATMIGLLAYAAAGPEASGSEIAAAVARVTDPAGTPITADAAGFAQASEILAGGGSVMYQGATGNVTFDENGDVSAPAVVWRFTEDGTEEVRYLSLDDVNGIVAGN